MEVNNKFEQSTQENHAVLITRASNLFDLSRLQALYCPQLYLATENHTLYVPTLFVRSKRAKVHEKHSMIGHGGVAEGAWWTNCMKRVQSHVRIAVNASQRSDA